MKKKHGVITMKSTEQINNELDKISTWEEFDKIMKENQIGRMTFGDRLYELCNKYHVELSELQIKTPISKSQFYASVNGTRRPSKKNVMKIAFSLGVNLEELNELLKLAKYKELYSRNEEEAIIRFGISNNKDIYEIDEMLKKRNSKLRLTDEE